MKKFLPLLLLSQVLVITAMADIRLPAIIGSHMVLQQNSACKLWGWSEPGEKINILGSWDTTHYKTNADANGKWMLTVRTPKAGGPYSVSLKGNNEIILEDVLIGEVWDCSGQSNMEMSDSWGKQLYSDEIAAASNTNIHFFHIPKTTSPYPQEDTKARWVVCNPADAKRFSMTGYFFGKQLNETLQVPVGLINASWGGTPAETWTNKDVIDQLPVLANAAAKLKPANGWPITPGYTYNAMIYPITNYNIAGVIWYQGEANVGTAKTYQPLLNSMITSWRAAWQKDFPFYFVQIAPFSGYGNSNDASILREQQTKTMSAANTGMIVISDLVEDVKDIHPRNKKDVGIRLANLALTKTYGIGNLPFQYPMYSNMSVEKNKVKITFNNVAKGLMMKGDTISGFYIAGSDKIFVPAQAKIVGNDVVVSNKNIKEPVAVRFGFTSASMPNLFSKEGLPVNLFRTDDWDDVPTVK
ncbi:MAG: sialate O-acetylesterase [Bacteroidota bacterium]